LIVNVYIPSSPCSWSVTVDKDWLLQSLLVLVAGNFHSHQLLLPLVATAVSDTSVGWLLLHNQSLLIVAAASRFCSLLLLLLLAALCLSPDWSLLLVTAAIGCCC